MIQELYGEVFSLELLVQQVFVCCDDASLRAKMAKSVKKYIAEELYNPVDMVWRMTMSNYEHYFKPLALLPRFH